MNRKKFFQQVIGIMLIMLLLVGCDTLAATPTPIPPTATPTPILPTATTTPIPPTATLTPTPNPIYLSEREPRSVDVGWGTFSRGVYEYTSPDSTDNIHEGDPIVMHGVEYPHALFAHAPSKLVYDLGEDFSQFHAIIGLVDWIECGDGAQFVVVLDGTEIYRSPIMMASSEPMSVSLAISKGNVLELLTDHGTSDNKHCDNTIWGDPILQ